MHILDIISVVSDQIKSIFFHERSASHGTSLEYHQQGNQRNLKIHFFLDLGGLEGGQGKNLCFGYPEIIGDQMRYWLNKSETKRGE